MPLNTHRLERWWHSKFVAHQSFPVDVAWCGFGSWRGKYHLSTIFSSPDHDSKLRGQLARWRCCSEMRPTQGNSGKRVLSLGTKSRLQGGCVTVFHPNLLDEIVC
ncbi:hypothetical protein TNCV_3563901 [Trichonephila clavipes]|nr:hypothetical protein TNCV_3563901 [Trichonephila clavipes]